MCFILFSLITGAYIEEKAVIKVSEALKSNKSLTYLDLSCNKPFVLFRSHINPGCTIGSIAVNIFDALKSNTTLTLLNLNCKKFFFISFSINTVNDIGNPGMRKLSELLTVNTTLTSLDISGKILVSL
jgi:hypothetical protein